MMAESFAQLLEESLGQSHMETGSIITATVVRIEKDYVIVDAGFKSEGVIPVEQFQNEKGEVTVQVGDQVDVALEAIEDGFGETRLSREKAKRAEVWTRLEKACEDKVTIHGIISGKVKGGFTVEIENIRAFLPGSLVDIRPVRDLTYLEGKELEFKVIKMDAKRNNVVVSRRAVVEEESSSERQALLETIAEGATVKGVVKNLTDYGVFIDLGGVDGLLHITDMSWKRIKHPSEMLNVGDEINVVVLKYDHDKQRVSLGLKQLGDDPWVNITRRYPEGARLHGVVTNITDYGCFVEIEDGVEGLVHVSEMSWTNKNIHPSKVVKLGDEVEVMVLEIDEERRRISLGVKQCQQNPWDQFAESHEKNQVIKGKIKSITDFGIFIGLDGDIDGLVHLNDISWNESGEEAIHNYKKGDEIEAVILVIDPERERISLGIKQLENDPFASFSAEYGKGSLVKAPVKAVTEEGVVLDLGNDLEGFIKTADLDKDKVRAPGEHVKVGDEIEAKFIAIDRKNRVAILSVRAMQVQEEAKVLKTMKTQADKAAKPTLGDLMKEQLESGAGKEE